MGDLLTSVPGDIPGLLQRGAPIIDDQREPGVVSSMYGGGAMVGMRGRALASLRLDLTTPLGRAVGWAWLAVQRGDAARMARILAAIGLSPDGASTLADDAMRWHPMTAFDVDRFARLILAVGGVS